MENYNVEYKENWKDEYLKIIASFANTDGEILFIGKKICSIKSEGYS